MLGAARLAVPLITRALKCDWANAPYHLRLELMHVARMCWRADEADRTALVEAIEALPQPTHPFISTAIVDALQGLGALEMPEREHEDVVQEEIKECLTNPNDPSECAAAYGIYAAQFDHPFSGAYCEVFSDLSSEERTQLLIVAARGADDWSFFLRPLIIELALSCDSRAGPSIARWTALPATDSFMPQDAIGVFIVAHIALGRLAYALPGESSAPNGPVADALAACGQILYWRNRVDLSPSESHGACHRPLDILSRHTSGAALNVVRNCEHAFVGDVKPLFGRISGRDVDRQLFSNASRRNLPPWSS